MLITQINKKDFENFFQQAISELIGKEFDKNSNEYTFEETAEIRSDLKYTSRDYYKLDFYRKYTIDCNVTSYETLLLSLSVFAPYYPINIELSLKESDDKVICVKVDPRHRRPSELKNHETGHPPFKVIR